MIQYALKIFLTAGLIVAASEIGKRSALMGAILISLPLSSILALSFLHVETGSPEKVISLAKGILMLILPSLAFFIVLIALLKLKQNYWISLVVSCSTMAVIFSGYSWLLKRWQLME